MSSLFITLTYDTKYVPIVTDGMTLVRHDPVRKGKNGKPLPHPLGVQNWIKRVRKAHGKSQDKIKYFAVGEYGSKSMRPHYHVIMFNCDLAVLLGNKEADMCKRYPDFFLNGKHLWYPKSWPYGNVTIGAVSGASIGYCLKYMMKPKKVNDNDTRCPEFAFMSKGLGIGYFKQSKLLWHHADRDQRMYIPIEGGKKISMPRYYKDRLYSKQEREEMAVHHTKVANEKLGEIQKEAMEMYGSSWEEKLKEQILFSYEKMYENAKSNRTI